MELECSSPHSQVVATIPYPEPARSSPYPHITHLNIHLNIIFPSAPVSPQWSLSISFPHINPVHSSPLLVHSTCTARLILLDFITRTILGDQYKSLSSSLCISLNFSVTSSLLGPNILLNTLITITFFTSVYLNV